MKEIILSANRKALIDDEDFEVLSLYRWHFAVRGYAARKIKQGGHSKTVYMHRQIMLHLLAPGFQVDHISGDGLDNRRANLRICSKSQNQMNASWDIPGKLSKFKGVTWHKNSGLWHAKIKKDGKTFSLKYHKDEETAAQAYNIAAQKLFGEYARLNEVGKAGVTWEK